MHHVFCFPDHAFIGHPFWYQDFFSFFHVHMCKHTSVRVLVEAQGWYKEWCFISLPPYSLRQGLSQIWLVSSARLLWGPISALREWNYRWTQLTGIQMGSGNLNSDSHAFTASTLTTKPASQPQKQDFLTLFLTLSSGPRTVPSLPITIKQQQIIFIYYVCTGKRKTYRSQFSPSTIWSQGLNSGCQAWPEVP